MPANEEDNVSTHSNVSYSDFNRFKVSDNVKNDIYSQIPDSEESLPLWGDEKDDRPRQGEAKEVVSKNATLAVANADVPDESNVLTPKATRKEVNPLEKIPTAQDDQGSGKGSRPSVLRRLTTKLKRVSTSQRS